jgi:hypothetical protein
MDIIEAFAVGELPGLPSSAEYHNVIALLQEASSDPLQMGLTVKRAEDELTRVAKRHLKYRCPGVKPSESKPDSREFVLGLTCMMKIGDAVTDTSYQYELFHNTRLFVDSIQRHVESTTNKTYFLEPLGIRIYPQTDKTFMFSWKQKLLEVLENVPS